MLKSKSCLITEAEMQAKILKEAEHFAESGAFTKRAITIRMMSLKWFTHEKEVQFVGLTEHLNASTNGQVFIS